MNEDLVPITPAIRAVLTRIGVDVSRAMVSARSPANGAMTTVQFFAFWQAVGESSAPDVGLRMASETQVHEYSLSSLAAIHSPDARTAFEKLARYKRLCGPKTLEVSLEKKEVSIHTTWLHGSDPPPPRLIDALLAGELLLIQRGTGLPIAPKRVDLTRARADEGMLMRFFGCPIRFKQRRDALVLEPRTLDQAFVTRNDDLLQTMIPGLDAKLAPLVNGGLVDQVRGAVARRMRGEKPSVDKIAREMAMSPRTLQRRLEELGVSYQSVLDQVRHETALGLLRASDVTVAEVAFLLGFEELNSFSRAFRTWEGTTPNRWRSDSLRRRATAKTGTDVRALARTSGSIA